MHLLIHQEHGDINAVAEKVSLEWDGEHLKISLAEEKEHKVLAVIINALKDMTYFLVEEGAYCAKISDFQMLYDLKKEKIYYNPSCKDLFNFMSEIKSNEEEVSVVPQNENDVDEIKGKATTSSSLEEEAIKTLIFQIKNMKLPKPKLRTLTVSVLQHDFSIRDLSQPYVEEILLKMKNNMWQHQRNLFVVYKPKNSALHFILDGNNRFAAIKKFNEENDNQKILNIQSPLFHNLHQTILTYLQTVELAIKIMAEHAITAPANKKVEKSFNHLMQAYFNNGYPSICTNILCLPQLVLTKLFTAVYDDQPLNQIDLSANFWKAFIQAFKRDEEIAFETLSLLADTRTDKVEKELLAVEVNFLEFLREKAPHNFETEEEAVEFLGSGRVLDKNALMKHLEAVQFMHNRKRPSTSTVYWQKLQKKVLTHFEEHAFYNNTIYAEGIDPSILPIQNMVITNVLTPSFLELLDENSEKFVILLLSNYGESSPQLPNINPTATFNVLMEDGALIDSVSNYLPPTTISASLFLPEAPEDDKVRYLRNLAMEKGCYLGTTISIQKLSNLCKLSSDYDAMLLYITSTTVTETLLKSLNYFKNVTVSGNVELKELAGKCKPFAKKETKSKAADEFI